MNPAVAGAVAAGLLLGLGLWSLASLAPRMRQPRLARRVAPYLQDVSAGARESLEPPSPGPIPVLAALVEPVISPVHRVLAAVSGSDDDLAARLRQAGRLQALATHRTQQLLWAIAGAAIGVAVGAVVSPTAGLVLTPVLSVAGVLLRDRLLVVQARRRLTRLTEELPVVLELLALSLSAGESATDAVRRVARVGSGELSREFAGAVASVSTGVPFAAALDELARELGLPPLRRCVDQVLGALDRGTPLAEVLLAQAQDARDEARRGFIEAAGRREIAMLVPVNSELEYLHEGSNLRADFQRRRGDQLGVTRQQDDCLQEAARRGWEVVGRYVDNDVSATRSKVRPEYVRLLRDIDAGIVEALIVWDVDRLTRTPRELEDIIDLADSRNLALANVGGDIDLSTPQGKMMARIKGTVARHEVEQQSRRLKRKFRERAEAGHPHGYTPYGFRRVQDPDTGVKRDVVDPEEAAIIREAADRVLAHASLRSIISDLNRRGVHGPKSAVWNSTILRQILLRPTNAGLRQYQGKVIGRSTSEAIYDESTYDRLVAILKDPARKSNHVGPGYKYLLSGLAICGRCGGVMRRQVGRVSTTSTGSTKRQPPTYACGTCFRVRRIQTSVDEIVEGAIVGRLSRPDAITLFARNDTEEARDAEIAIEAIDAKLRSAADSFAGDLITIEQLGRITARLRTDRDAQMSRLGAARPDPEIVGLVGGDVRAKWEALTIDVKREFVERLLRVEIMPAGSGTKFDPELVKIVWHNEPERDGG